MQHNIRDNAILTPLILRMTKYRLPRLLKIREKVNANESLNNFDLSFMKSVGQDIHLKEHYIQVADNDLKELLMKALGLYKEISEKAFDNEQKKIMVQI